MLISNMPAMCFYIFECLRYAEIKINHAKKMKDRYLSLCYAMLLGNQYVGKSGTSKTMSRGCVDRALDRLRFD